MSDQYLRKCSLIVSDSGKGLDLSEMRIVFKTTQSDVQTPNAALIRVYNLSDETAQSVKKEFTAVRLQAGYETGAFGTIFDGTIKQVRRGRENPTDTYLDILAADGDKAYNQGVISKSLAAGATPSDERKALIDAMGIPAGYVADMPPGAAQRGQVKYGMARDYMRDLADTNSMTWSIQNGQVQMIPTTGFRPGTAVVLNSNTGMIGLPVQTEGGILVKCLLNPNIKIGCLLQIDNKSIQGNLLGGKLLNAPGRLENLQGFQPKITDDGFYRVYVNEFEGDTRGLPWWNNITCLAVDRSAPAAISVKAPA
jgi:baseplate hub protein gp41